MKKYFIGETVSLSEFLVAALLLVLLGSARCAVQNGDYAIKALGWQWAVK